MAPKRFISLLSSLRLTVVCLALSIILVFVGTMSQVDMGIYAAQAKYFRSLFVWWSPVGGDFRLPVFPGGYLIGGILVVNLVCAHAVRFGFRREKMGLGMIHAGLILMLLGQLATDALQVESAMELAAGQTKNYSEDQRHSELAIMDVTRPDLNDVVAVPEGLLAKRKEIPLPKLPFTVRVLAYYVNATNVPPGTVSGGPAATQGIGLQAQFTPLPAEVRTDMRNLPAAYIELVTPSGSLGTWAVSDRVDAMQALTYQGRRYELVMRFARYYLPFSLELKHFAHDRYMGTGIDKNFSSLVRLRRPDTGEDREVRIYMNNPLRYGGETFYQASFRPDDSATILQVVRNPGWLTPYFSCVLVGSGLVVQFLTHLVPFVKRRGKAKP